MKTAKITWRNIDWSTRSYELSHGKEPKGRGAWMFCPAAMWNTESYLEHCVSAPSHLTLTEAKKFVAEKFIAAGCDHVVVCP